MRWSSSARCCAASGRAERATSRARGDLATTLADLLRGAAELQAFGAQDIALGAVRAADRKLTALARRSAVAAGLGSELTTAVAGMTLWGVLVLVTAVAEGTLTRVPLAVVTLTALVAFEAVTVLPAAALQLGAAAPRRPASPRCSTPQCPSPTPRIQCPALPPPAATSTSPASPASLGSAALTQPTASMFHRCC